MAAGATASGASAPLPTGTASATSRLSSAASRGPGSSGGTTVDAAAIRIGSPRATGWRAGTGGSNGMLPWAIR